MNRHSLGSAGSMVGAGALLLGMLVAAPWTAATAQDATPGAGSPTAPLEVELTDAEGNDVGTASFTEAGDGIALSLAVEGLTPGEHGWHLHAMGMCDPSGLQPFSTAGPHWNPTAEPHGGLDDEMRHVGDFGNVEAGTGGDLTADADGSAIAEITTDRFTLGDGPTSVFDADGTAIIIHDGADDLVSQPAGNAGGRYACGVVAAPMAAMPAPTPTTVEGHVLRPMEMPFSSDMLANLELPDGFTIEAVAQGLDGPRLMALGPDGTLYVTQPDANTVSALRDADGDNVYDEAEVVADNLTLVHGITVREDRLYLAGEKQVWVADFAADGGLSEPTVLIDGLPDGDQHPRRTIEFGPDGMLYVHIGSSCNACRESVPENATILRFNPDGSGQEIFASGLRNTLGYGWHPETGELWGMDMGTDWRGDDQPPDELNRIVEGGNYGWPFCYADQEVDPNLSYPPPGSTPQQYCANTVGSVLDYQAHSSPIELVYYTADQFPAEYQGDAFVTMRGSWNRAEATGYKVVRVDFENGEPVGFEDFVTGWLMPDGTSHFGRVAGLLVTPDGSLLISDDANGVIYRVSHDGGSA